MLKIYILVLTAELKSNLYEICPKDEYRYAVNTPIICDNANCIIIWHKCLRHKNFESTKYLGNYKFADGMFKLMQTWNCTKCTEGKMSQTPYAKYQVHQVGLRKLLFVDPRRQKHSPLEDSSLHSSTIIVGLQWFIYFHIDQKP